MRWIRLVVCLCCVAAASPRQAHPSPAPPTVVHYTGRFVGFSEGDYVYAAFCIGDSIVYLGVSETRAAYFVAAHPGTQLDVEARLISEVGWEPVEYGLMGASLHGYTSEVWWAGVQQALGYQRAYAVFDSLEASLTDTTTYDCSRFRSSSGPRR